MNRTIKEATLKSFHYDNHQQLETHLQTFIDAYNFSRRLKTLKGLTPHEFICKSYQNKPQLFKSDPYYKLAGLYTLVVEPDLEWVFIDGCYAKAHQHSARAAGGRGQAIGKSKAGNSSKIHLAVDAFGLPVAFEIAGGKTHDCKQVPALIEQVPTGKTFIGDRATIVRHSVKKLNTTTLRWLSQKNVNHSRGTPTWIKVYIATDTWLKIPSPGSNNTAPPPCALTSSRKIIKVSWLWLALSCGYLCETGKILNQNSKDAQDNGAQAEASYIAIAP